MKRFIVLLGLIMNLPVQATPIFNLFELGIQNGKNAHYDAVGEYNIHTSIQSEKGTLAMYSLKQKSDPNVAYMLEIYADETAYKTHIASPQYLSFLEASPHILTDHKKRIALNPQFLADKKVQPTEQNVINLVTVEVNTENNQAFTEIVTTEMAQIMKREKDAIALYAATQQDQPHKWFFIEIYADDITDEKHQQAPEFEHYLSKAEKMITNKQIIEIVPAYLENKGGLQFSSPLN